MPAIMAADAIAATAIVERIVHSFSKEQPAFRVEYERFPPSVAGNAPPRLNRLVAARI
jgi:hypothetical protein